MSVVRGRQCPRMLSSPAVQFYTLECLKSRHWTAAKARNCWTATNSASISPVNEDGGVYFAIPVLVKHFHRYNFQFRYNIYGPCPLSADGGVNRLETGRKLEQIHYEFLPFLQLQQIITGLTTGRQRRHRQLAFLSAFVLYRWWGRWCYLSGST